VHRHDPRRGLFRDRPGEIGVNFVLMTAGIGDHLCLDAKAFVDTE
jgi:hypothetical protein